MEGEDDPLGIEPPKETMVEAPKMGLQFDLTTSRI
jgi:hypothetical protein